MTSPVFASVLLLALASLAAGEWERPKFCHSSECPVFSVQIPSSEAGYELRTYEQAQWVTVNFGDSAYREASFRAFDILFKYISGENVQAAKIDMTAPVLTKSGFVNGAMTGQHEVSFYIPYEMQDSVIQPTNPEVYITSTPANFNVYVTTLSGYPSVGQYESAANALMAKLASEGKPYVSDHIYTGGYDSPFRVFGRHNEVWVVAAAE